MSQPSGAVSPPPDRFDVHVPLLVAGGGACGLTAAIAAAHGGAETVVLERYARCEGSSSMSLGALCAAGTCEQRLHGVEDTPEAFERDILDKTGGRADPLLARVVSRRAGEALDWLAQSAGVPFELDREWRPAYGHTRQRMHATPGRSGEDMMARLLAATETAGASVLTDARVVELFAEAEGTVRGVRILRPDGSHEAIGCDALILATCGYGANPQMVARHIPEMAACRYFGWEGSTGDAAAWGEALGAQLGDLSAYQGLGLLAEPQGLDVNPKLLLDGGVQVNLAGERFSDEVADVSGQGARVAAQPGGVSWVVYDERIHRAYAHLPQYRRLLEMGARRTGDSVEALAERTHLPAEALGRTLEAISALEGRPDAFGRRFDTPPLAPSFHALKVTGALFHTQGGLQVDEDARVVRNDGRPFPNLYAGGGAARSIGGPGGSGYLPGAGLCMAVTLGWIAGSAAAARITASPG